MARLHFSLLALATSLAFAACAPAEDQWSNPDGSKADEGGSSYVGLYVGLDAQRNSCEVEVLSFEEHMDGKIDGSEDELAKRQLTKIRRTMQLKVSFQEAEDTVFTARSVFDEQSLAYANNKMTASNPAEGGLSEEVEVTLDLGDATLQEVGYELGSANGCVRLERFSDSLPEEQEPPSEL